MDVVANFAAASESNSWAWGWDAVAAIGTVVAATVALLIWAADRWAAARRRKNEAQLLAVILAPRLNSLKIAIEKLVGVIEAAAEEGFHVYFDDQDARALFADAIDAIDISKFPSTLDGFASLPMEVGALFVDTLTCVQRLKSAATHFRKLRKNAPDERVIARAKQLAFRLYRANHKVSRAWKVCTRLRPKYDLLKNLDRDSGRLKLFFRKVGKVFSAAWAAAKE
ncbi:hypothetical protein [Lysobacter sp. Hz 25]|uniref:hypothetical protein n=1 Tax=Lysobacter sp. Hz 25 TaxID=3383698 RepID=UPI0038D4DC3F